MTLIRRGQIYFADFGSVVELRPGTPSMEIARQRPAVVISIDALNRVSDGRPFYVVVVPGTTGPSSRRSFPTNVLLGPEETGLPQPTTFVAHQIRSIDSRRLQAIPVGKLTDVAMTRIEAAVRYSLGLGI